MHQSIGKQTNMYAWLLSFATELSPELQMAPAPHYLCIVYNMHYMCIYIYIYIYIIHICMHTYIHIYYVCRY
jgi:hypothetical protein